MTVHFQCTKRYRDCQFLMIVKESNGEIITLRDFAKQMGVSFDTARFYSKRLQKKKWIRTQYVSNDKGLYRKIYLTAKGKKELDRLNDLARKEDVLMVLHHV